jgi:hypothetical protein
MGTMIDAMTLNTIRNTIRARLTFSFRGEDIALESIIDLDHCDDEATPHFHQWLARAGNIDPYSYQYEVLESEEIAFDQPTGLAVACCADGCFDWAAFVALRREARDLEVVRAVARQTLGIDDLDAQGKLKAALLAAYRAGLARRE